MPRAFSSIGGASVWEAPVAVRCGQALDCPPGFSSILERAIAAADLVLVPTRPGELDLATVASTAAMAERAGAPFRFALNRAVFRRRLAGDAVRTLRAVLGRLSLWPRLRPMMAGKLI